MPAFLNLGPGKNLRTGRSVWSQSSHPPLRVAALKASIKADIAIVGAGISGAFMAHAFAPLYDRVVVLDRRAPGCGSTHASTAMLQFEIDTPLTKLADMIGPAKAAQAWARSWRATQGIMRLVREDNIRCGLEAEAKARARAGLPCEILSGRELKARFGIDRTGAILSSGAAVADPVALSRGLLQRARALGAQVFAPANVQGVMATKHGVMLDVGQHFVEAKAVIFCTGYETVTPLPTAHEKITSSWAAATAPRAEYPDWLDRTLVWEAAKPYLYLRTTTDGRLLVGGEDAELDSPSYRADTLAQKGRRLARKTARLLPGVKPKWSHVWAGAFGESSDGLPVIDAVPDMPGCFTVLGFGGNGTVYARLAAEIMPGLVAGRRPVDSGLFAFR
jgi:glycine/D-amino acid oxidase-like deaminating enzyme